MEKAGNSSDSDRRKRSWYGFVYSVHQTRKIVDPVPTYAAVRLEQRNLNSNFYIKLFELKIDIPVTPAPKNVK